MIELVQLLIDGLQCGFAVGVCPGLGVRSDDFDKVVGVELVSIEYLFSDGGAIKFFELWCRLGYDFALLEQPGLFFCAQSVPIDTSRLKILNDLALAGLGHETPLLIAKVRPEFDLVLWPSFRDADLADLLPEVENFLRAFTLAFLAKLDAITVHLYHRLFVEEQLDGCRQTLRVGKGIAGYGKFGICALFHLVGLKAPRRIEGLSLNLKDVRKGHAAHGSSKYDVVALAC